MVLLDELVVLMGYPRVRTDPRAVGGTRLVGRTYLLRGRTVEVLTGWGPGATMRNVRIRDLGSGEVTVRPFRGLRRADRLPEPPPGTPGR